VSGTKCTALISVFVILQNVVWPRVSADDGDFLCLDIDTDLQIKNRPGEGTCSKWTDLCVSLGCSDFDTYWCLKMFSGCLYSIFSVILVYFNNLIISTFV
jgi:hypothetical protein